MENQGRFDQEQWEYFVALATDSTLLWGVLHCSSVSEEFSRVANSGTLWTLHTESFRANGYTKRSQQEKCWVGFTGLRCTSVRVPFPFTSLIYWRGGDRHPDRPQHKTTQNNPNQPNKQPRKTGCTHRARRGSPPCLVWLEIRTAVPLEDQVNIDISEYPALNHLFVHHISDPSWGDSMIFLISKSPCRCGDAFREVSLMVQTKNKAELDVIRFFLSPSSRPEVTMARPPCPRDTKGR